MSLQNRMKEDRHEARKFDDKVSYGILTVMVGEFDRIDGDVPDEKVISLTKKMIDACEMTNDHEQAAVLKSYIPQQLSEVEIEDALQEMLVKNPDAKMGQMMGFLKQNYSGMYDGKVASGVAKRLTTVQ